MTLPTPFSYRQVQGDGSTTVFTFTFDYLEKAHVQVYVDTTLQVDGTGYTWSADKQITMTTAPTAAQTLTIRRVTPESDQIIDWTDGSHLIADDLNTSDKQWLYLIQEHHDILMRMIYGLPPIPGPGIPVPALSFWNRLERGDDPNVGTATEVAQTIGEDDQLKARATSAVQNGIDAYVMTLGALSARYDVIIGPGAGYPGAGNTGQVGKFRVDPSVSPPSLFVWTGTAWQVITTGGGGGQGTVTNVIGGPGITVANPTTTPKISADVGNGLSLGAGDPDTIQVNAYHGIIVDSNGVSVDPYQGIQVGSAGVEVVPHHGITVNANGVSVDPHHGITSDANGVSVNLNATNPGLAVDANGLRTDGNQTGLGTVQFGTGTNYTFPATDGVGNAGNVLTTDGAGTLTWTSKTNPDGNTTYTLPVTSQNSGSTARLTLTASDASGDDPVDIKAGTNISFTSIGSGEFTINAAPGGGGGFETVLNTTALNAKALSASRTPGDTFLVVDSTNIDSAAIPGTAPNEAPTVDGTAKAIAGLPATPPSGGWGAAINVVVAWNSADDGWDFVNYQAGQPDVRYAKSDVGNGTLAAFPPAGPKVGDIWYNLEDGRTYTFVDDGNTEQWVDTAPQGSGILWKQTVAGKVQPAVDTDDIRHPKFTGNVAGGTRAIMATAAGDLVANVVGPGLEISGGVLQVKRDASATGTNLQSVCDAGNTTTTGARFKDDVKIAATAAGDGDDTFGVHLRDDGQLTAYKGTSTGTSPVAVFKSDVGGSNSINARINADGGASFAGTINNGYDGSSTTASGCNIESGGVIYAQRPAGSTFSVWGGFQGTTRTSTIGADGSAVFAGDVTVGDIDLADAAKSGIKAWDVGQLSVQRADGTADNVQLFRGVRGTTDVASIFADGSTSFAGTVEVSRIQNSGSGADPWLKGFDGSTETLSISNDGRITLQGSGSVEGIQFGSTDSSGSITSQTLDDYEEGTWTPKFNNNGSSVTTNVTKAVYTKVGQLVTAQCQVRLTSKGTVTGTNFVDLYGLPFNSKANEHGSASVGFWGQAATNLSSVTATVQPSASYLQFRALIGTGDTDISSLKYDQLNDGGSGFYCALTVSYITAS